MKSIRDSILNESAAGNVNVIVLATGSMDNAYLFDLFKAYPKSNWYEIHADGKIRPLKYYADFDANGPHPGNFDSIQKFFEEHLGDLNILVGR